MAQAKPAKEPRRVAGIGGQSARAADAAAFYEDMVRRREEGDRAAREALIKSMAQERKRPTLGHRVEP